MSQPPPLTYIGIPPPPLPEFLQRAQVVSDAAEVESPPSLDGVDERWQYRKATTHTETIEKQKSRNDVPPLAVYHICRICLRPRSTRYHNEHPIPIDGVPPPPGICRRCRVVSVDDTKHVTEVVEQSESKGPKLGLKCLVPDMAYTTNEEMRSRRASHILHEVEQYELEPPRKVYGSERSNPKEKEEIVYRHIHVTVPPPPPAPVTFCPPPPTSPPPRPQVFAEEVVQDAVSSTSHKSSSTTTAKESDVLRYRPIPRTRPPPSSPPPFAASAWGNTQEFVNTTAATQAASSISSRKSSTRHTSVSKHGPPAPTESEIRRLARDEVVRYRQAERKIEAHKDPYAHGRLVPVEHQRVPVERRIELEKDVAEPMPWHQSAGESRRDSAFALPKKNTPEVSRKKERETIIAYQSARTHDADEDASQKASSSCSSDKTRWPGTEMKRTYRVSERDFGTEPQRDVSSRKEAGEVFEVVEKREPPQERRSNAETRYYKITRRESDVSETDHHRAQVAIAKSKGSQASTRRSTWTDREYWEGGEPARTASQTEAEGFNTYIVKQRTSHDQKGETQETEQTASQSGKVIVLERQERTEDLPYPYDDHTTPLSMPSPSSHASRPARSSKARDEDKEYYYKLRTVEPVDQDGRRLPQTSSGNYYRETAEYLHRRKPAEEEQKSQQSATPRPESKQRRPSDVSSRVRFANKLDISPTPPGSDASSAQFRNFYGRRKSKSNGKLPESGEDLVAEYERRGRQRSRTPSGMHGFYYERDVVRSHERGFRPVSVRDGDKTPRAAHMYAPSETATGLSTMPSNIRPIARGLSESPSREKLRATAMRQKSDGLPPYVVPESPDNSVVVEDGSTLASDSTDSYRREAEGRWGHGGGQRRKR